MTWRAHSNLLCHPSPLLNRTKRVGENHCIIFAIHIGLCVLAFMNSMASSLTRSTLSFRRQGSSGIVWREGLFPGESKGYGRSGQASNNNVDVALSEESSTNQVFLYSGSHGSNRTRSAGTAYRGEGDRTRRKEITSNRAPGKTNSCFIRWVKRAFSKSSSASS